MRTAGLESFDICLIMSLLMRLVVLCGKDYCAKGTPSDDIHARNHKKIFN